MGYSNLRAGTQRDRNFDTARLRHAKTNELDLKPLLKRANLPIGQINNPDARLRASNQIRFLSLIADALSDDLLGFHLAQLIDIRELGFLYYISASSQTLGDA